MREVILYFPNNVLMAEFVLAYKLSRVETNAIQLSLTGFLTEQQIIDALLHYQAELTLIQPERKL